MYDFAKIALFQKCYCFQGKNHMSINITEYLKLKMYSVELIPFMICV